MDVDFDQDAGAMASDAGAGALEDVAKRCQRPRGAAADPTDIESLANYLDAMRRESDEPVALSCFVESLTGPLRVQSTASVFSAQPADSKNDPRIFLFLGERLILSVVPMGDTSNMLEVSELQSPTRSFKAEFEFPLEKRLKEVMADHRFMPNGISVCALCHSDEVPVEDYPFANATLSNALKPMPQLEVTLEYMQKETFECPADKTPERCALLRAVFSRSDLTRGEFPNEMPTFFTF